MPLLGLTAFVAVTVGNGVRPEYHATATIMYVAGRQETDLPSPYGSLGGANEVVGVILNSVETKRALADAGYTAAYEIASASRTSITSISIRADSIENAEGTGAAVIAAAGADLTQRQGDAGIPEAAQVTLQVLESPTVVEAVQNGKLRIQATIGVIGAGLALLAAVLFDDIVGLTRRRSNRRGAKEPQDSQRAPSEPARGIAAPSWAGDGPPSAAPGSTAHQSHEPLFRTDQRAWPSGVHPGSGGPQRRNPYFDPEFTKRAQAKIAAADVETTSVRGRRDSRGGRGAAPTQSDTAPRK